MGNLDLKGFNIKFDNNKTDSVIHTHDSIMLDTANRNANEERIRNWKLPLYSELSINTIFEHIWINWIDIFGDIIQPKGRSFFDAFWIKDRPFYIGITFILLAIIIQIMAIVAQYN